MSIANTRDNPTRDDEPTMTQATTPTLELNNGVTIPALGLGVFQTPPDETREAVRAALGAGYRHIDTAAAYGNERQVGEAVHSSGQDRSEIVLETKIWISDYGYDETLHGFQKSARKLGVEQIDLLILHQPLPSASRVSSALYASMVRSNRLGRAWWRMSRSIWSMPSLPALLSRACRVSS